MVTKIKIMKMLKFIFLFLIFIAAKVSQGQILDQDSLNKSNAAKSDAEFFKLKPQQLKMFRKNAFQANSDYFKPTLEYTSNVSLINDSVYVSVFKTKAFQKALLQKKRTLGHKILVGVGIYYGFSLVVTVALILTLPFWFR